MVSSTSDNENNQNNQNKEPEIEPEENNESNIPNDTKSFWDTAKDFLYYLADELLGVLKNILGSLKSFFSEFFDDLDNQIHKTNNNNGIDPTEFNHSHNQKMPPSHEENLGAKVPMQIFSKN